MFAWLRNLVSRIRPVRDDSVGAVGERLAAAWLEHEKGFRIVARNWRSPRDRRLEIDVIARVGPALVFVEVKSRPAAALVPGYFSAVTPRKKQALLRAVRDYVGQLREKPRTVRFDVVEVATRAGVGEPEVRHFENVPLFRKEFLRGR